MANSQIKSRFDQHGYVFLNGLFTAEESQDMTSRIDHYIREIAPYLPEDKVFYEDKSDPTSIKQMFDMSHFDSYFEQLLWNSKVNDMAKLLLGENVDRGFVEYFNKPPRKASTIAGKGRPTPPHQDCYYFRLNPPQAITFWIPMEDVDEENGCLRYVMGSHKKGMRPHGRTQTLGFSQGIVDYGTHDDLENEVAMPAKTGDALAHHGMTIHRADENKSLTRSRKVLGLVYFGESAQEDTEAKRQYQEKLKQERQK